MFDARQVRRTSRRLGLVSQSSYRFERGVDPAGVEPALLRAVELLVEVGGARATHAVVGDGEQPPPREPIRLRPARIERVLGAAVGATEAARLLERLGAACELDGEGSLLVRVPSARHDLAREIDLIEEVARLRGYDRLPAAPPAFEMAPAEVPAGRRLAARVRERLAGMGLSEAVTLAFATASDNERFPGFHEDGALRLSNPLRSEQAYLRRSLIPGLLTAAVTNVRGGVRAVALFSCGRTFSKSGERECVAGLLCGPRPGRGLKWAEEADFFDAKAAAEAVVAAVRPAPELKWRRLSDWPGCHPGACAAGCVGGTLVAVAGLVHPEVTEELELPATAVFEVALDRLAARPAGAVRLAPISKYPAASRDVSLLVPEDRLAGEVIDLVRGLGDPRVEDVWLFDEYRGAGVPDGYRALGFSIVYRAPDYTMTDEEIQELHERVVDAIVRELGAERRV
ncbi:MAG: phenylalanine--tRNA ligase subunit beta [Candidatus Dadabacteria bacterium]|nr:MAG: phenylalanine--tRNA ligase subunit beta [Candidatus Dadabacteria bacterium]